MAKKLTPDDEPTAEIPVELHENLVRQTLRMNPSLAPDMDAKSFIEHQTGKFKALTPADLEEDEPKKSAEDVRIMDAFFADERKKHTKIADELRRKKLVLEKEASAARKRTIKVLVKYLATHLRSAEDLKELLSQNKVFLEELAISDKELIRQTTELRRKQRE